eukprot:4860475-Karenia_brevis.AAC.1
MTLATKRPNFITAADDKNAGRTWVCRSGELALSFLDQTRSDPNWTLMPHLSVDFVKTFHIGISLIALPSRLRKR